MTSRDEPSWLARPTDRRQPLKGLGIGAAALTVPGLLAACGGSSPSASGGGGGKVSAKSIASLNWALPTSTIVGLDIATAFEGNTQCVQVLGLEGLLTVSDTLGLQPPLATGWKYQESSLTYVFQIREGVKFWDGSPMTPDDVAFSLGRHIDPKVGSQIGAYFANVDAFTVTGKNEVTAHLKKPDPLVANALPFAPILSKAARRPPSSATTATGARSRSSRSAPSRASLTRRRCS